METWKGERNEEQIWGKDQVVGMKQEVFFSLSKFCCFALPWLPFLTGSWKEQCSSLTVVEKADRVDERADCLSCARSRAAEETPPRLSRPEQQWDCAGAAGLCRLLTPTTQPSSLSELGKPGPVLDFHLICRRGHSRGCGAAQSFLRRPPLFSVCTSRLVMV